MFKLELGVSYSEHVRYVHPIVLPTIPEALQASTPPPAIEYMAPTYPPRQRLHDAALRDICILRYERDGVDAGEHERVGRVADARVCASRLYSSRFSYP